MLANSARLVSALLVCAGIFAGMQSRLFSAPRPIGPRNVTFGPDRALIAPAIGSTGISQTEPAIAVSPLNSGNLVAGFFEFNQVTKNVSLIQPCRSAVTSDGGLSWGGGGFLPVQQVGDFCSDPSVGTDARGNFYYAYADIQVQKTQAIVDILVARSTDGGGTFPTFAVAVGHQTSTSLDKPYLTVDNQPHSKFNGSVYLAYTGMGIQLVSSRDAGVTWSSPSLVGVAPSGFFVATGSVPVVAPDGTVYVFYAQFNLFAADLSILFSRSTDGGVTWSQAGTVAASLPSPGFFTLKNADKKFGSKIGPGIFANSLPTAAVGPDGTLWVAWTDFPQGSCLSAQASPVPCANADVRLSVSRDRGASWSSPVKVSDDATSNDQFLPWIATHADGLLSLIWLDKRLDPNNENYDAFYTNTADGLAFLPNVRVSTVTSLIGTTGFIGDYQGLAVTATSVFPIWNDVRSGTPAIFTATGTLSP